MAASNETTTDPGLENMKNLAIEQQQCFYELLCDCMTYNPNEHKYLKQNIGYACFGPPVNDNDGTDATENNVVCNTTNQNEDADITDTVHYNEKATAVIDKIYNKICEHTIGNDDNKPIYFAIIYNMIVCPKPKSKMIKKDDKDKTKKEDDKDEMEKKDDKGKTKKKDDKDEMEKKDDKDKTKKEDDKDEMEKKDHKDYVIIPIPIFKIWRSIEKKTTTVLKEGEKYHYTLLTNTKEKKEVKKLETDEEYEIWYIDTSARVYKNWEDYKTNNKLFKCIMILPKDGFYQADPSYPITEDYSTVWLEIMDSPACSLLTLICEGGDAASVVTGTGAFALGVASLFTPLAPVVAITGLVATGVTAGWAMVRGTQQLVDRGVHEESISPLDLEAFPQWLTITGSAFGLGAMGGAMAISAAVSRGMTINTAARLAFNTVQGGNLFLNGVGIIYQSYCMINTFGTDEFSYLSAVSLATHLMFFAGTVVKVQFAGDIIQNNQAKIVDDYRNSLRTKRLRNRFNRIRRRAAMNNSCIMNENAEVIRYINNRNQLISNTNANANAPAAVNRKADNIINRSNIIIRWTIEKGTLIVNGIALLDPFEFVIELIRSGASTDSNQSSMSSSQTYEDDDFRTTQLWSILDSLLAQYHMITKKPSRKIDTSEFIPLLREMDSLNVNQNLLEKLFNIAIKLIQRSRNPQEFLLKTLKFVWCYCKKNMKQWGIRTRLRMQSIAGFNILHMIITALFEAGILDNLYFAFEKYIRSFDY